MTETVDLPETPNRPSRQRKAVMIGIFVVAITIVLARGRGVDDAVLAQRLTGTWNANDPSDASLHRRELPVSQEQLLIQADGRLTHVVEMASKPGNPDRDPWGWKIHKGRLYVRFLGDDASGQWLPGFAISVTDKTLSIHIKDHPPKTWQRVEDLEKLEHGASTDHGN